MTGSAQSVPSLGGKTVGELGSRFNAFVHCPEVHSSASATLNPTARGIMASSTVRTKVVIRRSRRAQVQAPGHRGDGPMRDRLEQYPDRPPATVALSLHPHPQRPLVV
jgi:hypothetical protein